METRQQELYSSVLGEGVVGDWGEEAPPGEEAWGKTFPSEAWATPTAAERGHLSTGLLDAEPLREAEQEGVASEVDLNNAMMTEEERDEIQLELAKLEEEISTLRQVLSSKERQHAELKHKLGITPLTELRNNFSRSWYDMQTSTAYKKTSETLSTAGQKTSAAFSTLGSAISRKFGDMSMIGLELLYPRRNSPSFKSFGEKVESTVSNMKVGGAGGGGGGGSFEEVLSSTAQASGQDTPTGAPPDGSERTC